MDSVNSAGNERVEDPKTSQSSSASAADVAPSAVSSTPPVTSPTTATAAAPTGSSKPKIGVIDVGGGLRGSFGAGVFDYCLDNDLWFDYAIGVSAGSANLASYLAGQRGRNHLFYTDYAFRPQYMSFSNLARTGNYLDLDYIYSVLSDSSGEYPLDYQALRERGIPFDVVVTDAATGKPAYFRDTMMSQDDYGAIKGSCCVPGINKPYAWKDGRYFDGGAADPIPLTRAFANGCDAVVVVLTRPRDFRRNPGSDDFNVRLIRHNYPEVAEVLANRAQVYNDQVEEALALEKEGKVLVVAPDAPLVDGLKTLTKDRGAIDRLYHHGYAKAAPIADFLP